MRLCVAFLTVLAIGCGTNQESSEVSALSSNYQNLLDPAPMGKQYFVVNLAEDTCVETDFLRIDFTQQIFSYQLSKLQDQLPGFNQEKQNLAFTNNSLQVKAENMEYTILLDLQQDQQGRLVTLSKPGTDKKLFFLTKEVCEAGEKAKIANDFQSQKTLPPEVASNPNLDQNTQRIEVQKYKTSIGENAPGSDNDLSALFEENPEYGCDGVVVPNSPKHDYCEGKWQ